MDFVIQLVINCLMLAGLLAIVGFSKGKHQFILSLAIINLVIFGLTLVIFGQELSLGSGLGLFAMFTLLRFRSKTMKPIEMSFLLIAICFGVLNAVYPTMFGVFHVLILEILILSILFFMIKLMAATRKTIMKKIRYEKLDLLKPEKHDLLMADLENKFKIPVEKVSIESISFSDSFAIIVVTLNLKKSIENDRVNEKVLEIAPVDQTESRIKLSRLS